MRLFWATLASAALVATGQAAPALDDLTGAELQMECRKAVPDFCRGYIQAVSEGLFTRGVTVCIDTEATSREALMNKVVPWIAGYSGELSELGVYQALKALYPCKGEGSDD